MSDVGIALIAILGLLILGFFFGTVLFKILLYDPGLQNMNIGKYLFRIAIDIIFLIIGAVLAFLSALGSFINNVNTNWRIYLFIGFVAVVAEAELQYGPQVFMFIDQGNTEFAVPIYQLYIINITNVLRVFYDVVICWLNLINSLTTILIQSIANVAYNCTVQNWQLVIDTFITAFQSVFISLGNFILALGANDLDLLIPTHAITTFLASFNNFFVCSCKDLSFLTTWALETLNDPSLPVALNGNINAGIEMVRQAVNTVTELFKHGADFFTCAQVSPVDARILCLVTRPPIFGNWAAHGCEGFKGVSEWIDALIRNAIYTFVPVGSFPVPRISPLLSNVTCAGNQVVANMLNTILHIDLFFPIPGYPPGINYLSHLDIDTPILHGQLAAGGINIFFTDIREQITNAIGCFFASGANFTVNYASMTTKIIIQLTVDPANILNWIAAGNAPTTPFEIDAHNMAVCGEQFASDINAALGIWAMELGNLTIAFSHIITDTIPQIPHFATWFISEQFFQDVNSLFFNGYALSIASGNVIRQLDHHGSNTTACPLTNPVTGQNNPIVTELELFCCSGALIDSTLRLITATISYFTLSLIDLIDGISVSVVFGPNGNGDLNVNIIPLTKAVLDSLSCILPSFFDFLPGGGVCPANPASTVTAVLFNLFSSVLDMILAVPKIIALVIAILLQAINNPITIPPTNPFPAATICNYFNLFYEATVGQIAIVINDFTIAIDCFIPSADSIFATVGGNILVIFGPGGTLEQTLCGTITFIFNALTIVIKLFQDPGGIPTAIFNLISTQITQLFNFLSIKINTIVLDIEAAFMTIPAAFTCVGTIFTNLFTDLTVCITSAFTNCNWPGLTCNIPTPTFPPLKRNEMYYYPTASGQKSKKNGLEPFNSASPSLRTMDSPCYNQIQSAFNESYSQDLRRLFKSDADRCVYSFFIAKALDRLLLRFNDSLPPIVDPLTFYDYDVGFRTVYNLTKGLGAMVDFAAAFITATVDYNGNVVPNQSVYFGTTWDSFALSHNVTDPLSIRIGQFSELFLYGFKNAEQSQEDGLFFVIWNFCYLWWKNFANLWKIPTVVIPNIARSIQFYPQFKKVAYQLSANISRSSGYSIVVQTFSNRTESTFSFLKEWFYNKSYTTEPTLLSNREAISNAYNKIKSRIDYNKEIYSITTEDDKKNNEKRETSMKKRMTSFSNTNFAIVQSPVQKLPAYTNQSYESIQKRDFPLPCINGICLNCTILDLVLNRFVDALFMCLNDSQRFIDPSPYFAQNGNAIVKPPPTIFVLPNLENYTLQRDGPKNSNDVAIEWLYILTANKVDWNYIIDYTGYFFTNNNGSDVNSWKFWVTFLVECNITSMTRCQTNPPGLGVWKALGWSIAFYLIVLTTVGFFLPAAASQVATYGLLAIPVVTIILGYFMSPWCLIPKPPLGLPLLPNCLFDDFFEGLWSINGNCADWQTLLPGLTTPTCPTAAQNFQRPFADWKQPPFLFTDGIRNIFFLIAWQSPSTLNFLLTTDIILFSWIREINYIHQFMVFDFGPAGITPQWISFFYVTLPSVIVPLLLGFIILLIAFFVAYPILLLFAGILGILAAAVLALVALIVGTIGTATDTLSFYRDTNNFNFVYVNPKEKVRSED